MTRACLSNTLIALVVFGLCGALAGCTSQPSRPESADSNVAAVPAPAGSPETLATPATANVPAATTGTSSQAPAPRSQAARPAAAAPAAVEPEPVKPAPPPPPQRFTLAADTNIAVYTTSALSTSTNKTGERFSATLAEPIIDGDWTVARRGAPVEGVVVDSDPGGRVKGVASITLALRQLTLADGRTVELVTSNITEQANTSKGKDAKKIGIGAGVGAAIGAIAGGGSGAAIGAALGGGAGTASALATRGEPATVPSESLVTFVVATPVTVTRIRQP